MNDPEKDQFEQQLQAFRPSALPPGLQERLEAARPAPRSAGRAFHPRAPRPAFATWLRWLIPVTASALVMGVIVWRSSFPTGQPDASPALVSAQPLPVKELKMARDLILDLDVVARLPNGEPMRFRYSEFVETVQMRDAETGAVVQRRVPGVEVIPVGFETY